MTLTVGIFDASLARITPRLAAEGLDVTLCPYERSGRFDVDGRSIGANELALDYLWISADVAAAGARDTALRMALECASLSVLQTFNAGLDHALYRQIAERGTRICNSSAQAVAISEFVMANVLSLFHPFERRRELQRSHRWERTPFRELYGSRWLIVGFGPIGRAVAHRARAFGAHTTVIRRAPNAEGLVDRVGALRELPDLLPEADVIVLACPLNAATTGLAGDAFFDRVKADAVFVNVARGELVDEAALLRCLDRDGLAAAVLDVFGEEPLPESAPLWDHPRAHLSSHTSFAGSGILDRWDKLFLENLARFASGRPLEHEVDPSDLGVPSGDDRFRC